MILRFAISILLAAIAALNSYAIMPVKSKSTRELAAVLPHSIEAERAVLGAAVLNPDAALEVLPILREEDFFLPQNRVLYRTIEQLTASGKPIDSITLYTALENSGQLDAAGGAGYLSGITDGIAKKSHVAHYAETVKEKSRMRSLIKTCDAIMQQAQGAGDSAQIIESAVSEILSLTADNQGAAKIREWNAVALSAVKELQDAKDAPKSICRLNFGLKELDEYTSGLRKKETALVVAPTSNGKSLITEQMAITADDDGYKGLIFSAEMRGEIIALRQLAYESDIFFYHVKHPESLTTENLDKLRFAAKRERNIGIVDEGITPSRVWALSEARKRGGGLDFVVVDYDQLVVDAGIDPDADENTFFRHQTDFIHKAVKFAKRLDICFILVAQLRKTPPGVKAGAKPTVDDIYGSSAMRNDPDVIIWILRDYFLKGQDKKYEKKARACVAKNRNGRTGLVKLEFDPQRVRFMDATDTDEVTED